MRDSVPYLARAAAALAVAVLVAVFLAACSGSAATAGTAGGGSAPAASTATGGGGDAGTGGGGGGGKTPPEDICPLFTTAEIGTILGKPVGDGASLPTTCTWTATDGKGSARIHWTIAEAFGIDAGDPSVTAVPGIGDQAQIGPDPVAGRFAAATKGRIFYRVSLDPTSSDDALLSFLRQFMTKAGA